MSHKILVFLFIVSISVILLGAGGLEAKSERKIESECTTSELPILLYHHIRPYNTLQNPLAKGLSVSPEEFEEQMKYFHKNGWQTTTLEKIKNNKVPCKTFIISFDDGYYDIYKNAFPILKKYNYTGIIGLIAAYIDESDYLTGTQIRELNQNGWEIASHTWHHPYLTHTPIHLLAEEIDESKHDLEIWFHKPIITFVYPGGYYGPKTLEQVATSKYQYALTTHFGYAQLKTGNFELPRINIPPHTAPERIFQMLEEAKNKN